MASKRTIKKALHGMLLDVVDECLYIQETNEKKTEATEKLMDEAFDFTTDALSKIHQAKSKKDYPALRQEMEDKGVYFVNQLNELQK
jgi:endo-alpha-1,4-polygalactosaminidase (GH114 family)